MKTPKGFKLIGHTGTDTGLLAISDPCRSTDDSPHNPFADWDAFCEAINKGRATKALAKEHKGTVVVGTGSDGGFPVYARIVAGSVAEVRIMIEELSFEVYEKESE